MCIAWLHLPLDKDPLWDLAHKHIAEHKFWQLPNISRESCRGRRIKVGIPQGMVWRKPLLGFNVSATHMSPFDVCIQWWLQSKCSSKTVLASMPPLHTTTLFFINSSLKYCILLDLIPPILTCFREVRCLESFLILLRQSCGFSSDHTCMLMQQHKSELMTECEIYEHGTMEECA